MFKFITHRSFGINLLAAIVVSALMILLFLWGLNALTRHGNNLQVPSIKGKNFTEAVKILEAAGFDYEVQDSVYYDSIPGLTIIKQLPEGGEVVKINRTVYLTVNRAVAPLVEMPNLVGQSYRNAEMLLQALGLKIGEIAYRSDEWRNSVLDQLYNGQSILEGTKIPIGSKIKLIISSGTLEENQIPVPDLIGLTYGEAKGLLEAQGIRIEVVLDAEVKDTLSGFIYKQDPTRFAADTVINKISPGSVMFVFLSATAPDKSNSKNDNK